MPPDKEVMMDATLPHANVFTHKGIDEIDEIETETGDYVLLFAEPEFYPNSLN